VSRLLDAVIVGAGPNGLAAAIALARAGHSVLVVEANATIGGGCRTEEITLPGFRHDICAAVHPLGVVSPFLRTLPLQSFGLEWVRTAAALAHPFDDGSAAVLHRSLDETAATIAPDGDAWRNLMEPFVRQADALFEEILKPVRVPRRPFLMARFGATGLRSCASLVRRRFAGPRARALFAGCAGHSFLSMDAAGSASFGLVLALAAHAVDWPVVRGGSQRLVEAMTAYLTSLGGVVETGRPVRTLGDVPSSRTVLFDLMPSHVERIAGAALPPRYRRHLRGYRAGPGVFKIDWALRGPIPWRARACADAATVHLGPTFEDIAASEGAVSRGEHADQPFVLVAQQSLCDATRAPLGNHTGWAYCHVPHGSVLDQTERVEARIERFAPGFRELILARRTMTTAAVQAHNANMIGGDVGGGSNDLLQLLFRPFVRWNPYTTPNPRLFLCSSATPPGGGVHGMCGYWAAEAALARLRRS
jgi:phytoene dehydrogenase-like protein